MIDAYVRLESHLNHLAPVWAALPPDRRGGVYTELNANEIRPVADTLGVGPVRPHRPPTRAEDRDPVIVAGGTEVAHVGVATGRPVILLEHGAGQRYAASAPTSASYSGGDARNFARLFLVPNEWSAAANRARYPDADTVIVGAPAVRPVDGTPPGEIAAVTFHWDCPVAPESGTGWHEWGGPALALAAVRPVIGHAHPRIAGRLLPWWEQNGVQAVRRPEHVAALAAVLVAENTSILYEFAAAGRPVVVLDCAYMRRDVDQGPPRFWDYADVGVRIDDPADLYDAVEIAVADPPDVRIRREAAVRAVFPYVGDDAARRAVTAILDRWP